MSEKELELDLPNRIPAGAGEQPALFDVPPDWSKHWVDMPDYEQKNLMPWKSIKVHFRNLEDRQAFSRLVNQNITDLTPSIWYPKQAIQRRIDDSLLIPQEQLQYPVYIVSKGRWESRLTARALDLINVPYHIVVEPQEYDNYASVLDSERILTLPFSNLGQGSIPARNWIWEHALKTGAARHWILDDNISGFLRLNENSKNKIINNSTFLAIEKFTDRFENIALSGMNYDYFAKRKQRIPPYIVNTRIYSCILIKNDIPYRWRGKYNEDTDLSLRVLKDGWCTVLFNTFLAEKTPTMIMKGGNTDELYQGDGRLKMAQSLQQQHPDVVTITEKFGRFQHHVNYREFRCNKLIKKQNHLAQGSICRKISE